MHEGQSWRVSFAEVIIGTAIGYLVALIVQAIVVVQYDLALNTQQNLEIVGWFTAASVIRQLILRRYFNARLKKILNQHLN